MRLRVLGTGTSIPSLSRGSSAYLLFCGPLTVLVDVGPSVVRRMLEFGHTVNDIDLILITHFHVDHVSDLTTFLFASNYGGVPRTRPLTVIGGKGIHSFYGRLRRIFTWIEPKFYELSVIDITAGNRDIPGFSVQAVRVRHNRESVAFRVEERGRGSVTFSGDTDYSRNLVNLARDTDLLVTECSFPERKVRGHLNLFTLEKIVRQARPRRVLMSHLYPDWESFRGVLHAPYLLGEDGLELEV